MIQSILTYVLPFYWYICNLPIISLVDCEKISMQLENNGATTGKIQIYMQLQLYDSFDKSEALSRADMTPEQGIERGVTAALASNNYPADLSSARKRDSSPPERPPIFDANMLNAATATKMGISFRISIQEIDLVDLKSVHPLTKNYPFVSAACGKWNETTSVGKAFFYLFFRLKNICSYL